MRFVPINEVQPGMTVAMDVDGYDGRTLVGRGTQLPEKYIKRLAEIGLSGVYVKDGFTEDIVVDAPVSPVLRAKGIRCLKNADIDGCVIVAKELVRDILNSGKIALDMFDLRSYDNYTFAHSVNVSVLCTAIGLGMNFSEDQLVQLCTAALLHDLGKQGIPEEILNKPERLTKEEYKIMKSHVTLSYEAIKDRWDLSSHIKIAVLYHHENEDGSGYPHGVMGDELNLHAKILHVADVYDALTSQRPYKKPYMPCEALEYLMGGCGVLFDQSVVETMIKCVPLYPRGSTIVLSDGRKGVVVENSGFHNLRPVIRLDNTCEIDLSVSPFLNLGISAKYEDAASLKKSEDNRKRMLGQEEAQKHILLVDDMITNLEMLNDILKDDYKISMAKSGKQAINFVARNTGIDLILMDIEMPDITGIDAAKAIMLSTDNSIPIMFVSSRHDKETVLACRALGSPSYIVRPYKPIYIQSQIRQILYGIEEV